MLEITGLDSVHVVVGQVPSILQPSEVGVNGPLCLQILLSHVRVSNHGSESVYVFVFGNQTVPEDRVLVAILLVVVKPKDDLCFLPCEAGLEHRSTAIEFLSELYLVEVEQTKLEVVNFAFVVKINFLEQQAEVRQGQVDPHLVHPTHKFAEV